MSIIDTNSAAATTASDSNNPARAATVRTATIATAKAVTTAATASKERHWGVKKKLNFRYLFLFSCYADCIFI